MPTPVKLLSSQWDTKRNFPIVGREFSDESNKEALRAMETLFSYLICFCENFLYLCADGKKIDIETIKNIIMGTQIKNFKVHETTNKEIMKVPNKETKKTPKATDLIQKAFKQYVEVRKPRETTAKQYHYPVLLWMEWIKTMGDDSIKRFSQAEIDKYRKHLESKGIGTGRINWVILLICDLINKYIIPRGEHELKAVETNKQKEDHASPYEAKKVELMEAEIQKFKDFKENPKYTESKKIFLLLLATGVRISDGFNLVKGTNIIEDKGGFLSIHTEKRGKIAQIQKTDETM